MKKILIVKMSRTTHRNSKNAIETEPVTVAMAASHSDIVKLNQAAGTKPKKGGLKCTKPEESSPC